jgi:hypothetical protein
MKVMKSVSLSTMTVPPPEYLLTIGIESLQSINEKKTQNNQRRLSKDRDLTFLQDQCELIPESSPIIP